MSAYTHSRIHEKHCGSLESACVFLCVVSVYARDMCSSHRIRIIVVDIWRSDDRDRIKLAEKVTARVLSVLPDVCMSLRAN